MVSGLSHWIIALLATQVSVVLPNYVPTWESLDSRPLPSWYDIAKFGIFIHWGVYSVPAVYTEWFWYQWKVLQNPECVEFMKKNYRPGFSYPEFAPMFKAEYYDPDAWAQLFVKSGARYVVLTSKHLDGFTNWKSNVSWNWNSVDNGPHRDLVGDLMRAVRKTDVHFGLYYSLQEWFNPLFMQDKANNYTTQHYIKAIMQHQLQDIVMSYKPDVLWVDGPDGAPASYWTSKDFLAWLYNSSPVKDTVVVNDRWGRDCVCHHGGYLTCGDQYNPGKLVKHKWENALKLERMSWGYRRNVSFSDILSIEELLAELVSTVSCGGNLLLNVGPTPDGRIVPIFQERLLQIGEWLGVNGKAIYGTKPWRAQNDTTTNTVWYTSKESAVYAIALDWPGSGQLTLGEPITSQKTKVKLLGYDVDFAWTSGVEGGMVITIPAIPVNIMPTKWAFTFKLTNVT